MKEQTKTMALMVLILSFSFLKLDAQEKKNTAEIKNFKIDSRGKISWEIYYISRELSYQLEFFEKGKWLVNSTYKQSVSMIMPSQKEEFSIKDSINVTSIGRYRLKITEPLNIISQEVAK